MNVLLAIGLCDGFLLMMVLMAAGFGGGLFFLAKAAGSRKSRVQTQAPKAALRDEPLTDLPAPSPEEMLRKRILAILAAVIYTVSPIDLVPDVIPILGWLDDVGVWVLLAKYLKSLSDRAALAREAAEPVPLQVISPTENPS